MSVEVTKPVTLALRCDGGQTLAVVLILGTINLGSAPMPPVAPGSVDLHIALKKKYRDVRPTLHEKGGATFPKSAEELTEPEARYLKERLAACHFPADIVESHAALRETLETLVPRFADVEAAKVAAKEKRKPA